MKGLNLSIYTGAADAGHKVTMTAEFDNHNEAVRFHEGVAKLCKDASHANGHARPWAKQLLDYSRK
jgi:pterin-4a-carbinolamine dehydratase